MVGPRIAGQQEFGGESGFVEALKKRLPKWLYELLEFGYSFIDYRHLSRAIRRQRPDVIYERYNLFWMSGAWARRRFDIPLISEVNAPLYDERSRYGGIALKKLARFSECASWRGADRVVTVTRVLAERIADEGVSRRKITVAPNGINPARFPATAGRADAKRRLGLGDSMIIGFVGFAREWHGLDRVIDVLAELADRSLTFLLVGEGDVCSSLKRAAQDRGVKERLRVTGLADRESVAGYVQAFDIALQPAVVDYASPLKLFEYMACGAAIVAPDKANIREILTKDHDALLFEPLSAEAFAAAVKKLCRDASLRARLGEAARRTLDQRELTWEHNARTVEMIAKDLISGQQSPVRDGKWGDSNV